MQTLDIYHETRQNVIKRQCLCKSNSELQIFIGKPSRQYYRIVRVIAYRQQNRFCQPDNEQTRKFSSICTPENTKSIHGGMYCLY